MSDFFPDVLAAADLDEPEELHQPVWLNPPADQLPGVAAVELVLGASDRAVVMLTGMRVFPVGVAMTLGVRTHGPIAHRDLSSELFDGPYHHDQGERWQRDRLKWGFEFSDARRATNLDVASPEVPGETPDQPVLSGGGGGGGTRSVDRDYWLWPLPPSGRLEGVCQWLELGIERTRHHLDADEIRSAAPRSRPLRSADQVHGPRRCAGGGLESRLHRPVRC